MEAERPSRDDGPDYGCLAPLRVSGIHCSTGRGLLAAGGHCGKHPPLLLDSGVLNLLSAPPTIPLVYCHINSFQRASRCGKAMARRRKEEQRAGIASRGRVRRWGRCSSRVRHRVGPDRERGPERCNASGSAVDVGRDAPAGTQWPERVGDSGVVDVSRALSVSPSVPRLNAQRVARCDSYNTRNCLPPKKLCREIQ